MDSGQLHKDLNFIKKVLEIRERQKRALFMLLKGNRDGFFQSNNTKFFKTKNSEYAVSISIEMSVFREGLKY